MTTAAGSMPAYPDVPSVPAAEAVRLAVGDAVLVDVREPVEWEAGHAPEAGHIPLGSVVAAAASLPQAGRVLVICRSGNRSRAAAEALRRLGIDAWNVDGGMRAWHQAGGSVVRPDGSAGTVI